jgi:mono/diheme cytochrome c family protein
VLFRSAQAQGLLLPLGLSQDIDLEASRERGKALYEGYCMACHLGQGEGVPNVFPPLAGADYLLEQPFEAAKAVKFGQEGEITVNGKTYNGYMASPGLSDQEVADVMNYILYAWENESDTVFTEAMVEGLEQ